VPATSVESYIGRFPPDIAFILERLRDTIRAAAPEATEEIKYDMPAFRYGGTYIVYVAAWKKHIGIYPIHRGTAAFEKLVAPYRAEKDTVQFQYKAPIPYELVSRYVTARMKDLKRKKDR
jgi:uncharacterized protein YdhG (YjbR/CyaY superfamily)